jgi:hypothetical protein
MDKLERSESGALVVRPGFRTESMLEGSIRMQ